MVSVDPDGAAAETVFDIASIGVGVASFISNVRKGNVGAAIVDAVGVVVDSAAAAVPFVPGGAGIAIKAIRGADKITDADRLGDAGELLLDTNSVIVDGKKVVESGRNAVKSFVSDIELNNLVAKGKIKSVPKASSRIPSVGQPDLNTRINVRGNLKLKPGKRGTSLTALWPPPPRNGDRLL